MSKKTTPLPAPVTLNKLEPVSLQRTYVKRGVAISAILVLLFWATFLFVNDGHWFCGGSVYKAPVEYSDIDMSVPTPEPYNKSSVNLANFVRRQGTYLFLGSNRFIFAGTNDYTLPFTGLDALKQALNNFQRIGVRVIRTWLHNEAINVIPGYRYMQRFNGWTNVLDESGLVLVDQLIYEASLRNIRIIFALNGTKIV
jgi:hypothetical protein